MRRRVSVSCEGRSYELTESRLAFLRLIIDEGGRMEAGRYELSLKLSCSKTNVARMRERLVADGLVKAKSRFDMWGKCLEKSYEVTAAGRRVAELATFAFDERDRREGDRKRA